MKETVYIGIDLAWGEKNLSGFCVMDAQCRILELDLIKESDVMLHKIFEYQKEFAVKVGIDAPLAVNNIHGNRDIEKLFLKDFSKYKISMLPINRMIMLKIASSMKAPKLGIHLLEHGFNFNMDSSNTLSEVYTHSTIAVLFNDYKIIPYKRKKGRSTAMIRSALEYYRKCLQFISGAETFFAEDISKLKGAALKDYEDQLDAITCAYTMLYADHHPKRCKTYNGEAGSILVTPI